MCIFESRIGTDAAAITVEQALKHANICHSLLAKAETPGGTQFHYVSVSLNQGIDKIISKTSTFKSVQYAIGPGSVHASGTRIQWSYRVFAALPVAVEVIAVCEGAVHLVEQEPQVKTTNEVAVARARESSTSSPIYEAENGHSAHASAAAALDRIAKMRDVANS